MLVITRLFIISALLLIFACPARAMVLAPSVIDLDVHPGEAQSAKIIVGNDETTAAAYATSLQVVDFSPDGLTFSEPSGVVLSMISLSPETFSLSPEQTQEITVRVNVPGDAWPTAHSFAALVTRQAEGDGNIGVASSAASLIFVSIDGDELLQRATISSFSVDGSVYASIENDGQGILRPSVEVTMRNALGQEVDRIDLNPELNRIPKGLTREFSSALPQQGAFFSELWREVADLRIGKFTAELSVAAYPSSQAITAKDHFWVWPWRLMLVVGIGLTLIIVTQRVRLRAK